MKILFQICVIVSLSISERAFSEILPPVQSYTYIYTGSPSFLGVNKITSVEGGPVTDSSSQSINIPFNILGVPNEYPLTATATAAPFGGNLSENAFVYASANATWNGEITAQGSTFYSFRINDPIQRILPVRFDYIASQQSGYFSNGTTTKFDGSGHTELAMGVFEQNTGTNLKLLFTGCTLFCFSDGYSPVSMGGGFFNLDLNTNEIYRISMTAAARAGRPADGAGVRMGINFSFADAFIDPYISIDKSYSGYELEFSPGVYNVPTAGAVPEPNSWMLMITGFGIVAVALRRRKKQIRFAKSM